MKINIQGTISLPGNIDKKFIPGFTFFTTTQPNTPNYVRLRAKLALLIDYIAEKTAKANNFFEIAYQINQQKIYKVALTKEQKLVSNYFSLS